MDAAAESVTGGFPPVPAQWAEATAKPYPAYGGTPLTAAGLRDVAWAAVDEAAPHHARARRIVAGLFSERILTRLDAAPGGAGLAAADRAWRELISRWRATVDEVERRCTVPDGGHVVLATDAVAGELLVISLDRTRAIERFRTQLAVGRDRLDLPVSWWDDLSLRAADDPLWLLAARQLIPIAAAEAGGQEHAAQCRPSAPRSRTRR